MSKIYTARRELRAIKYAMTIPLAIFVMLAAVMLVDHLVMGAALQTFPLALSLALIPLATFNVLTFHRQQSAWVALEDGQISYGRLGEQPRTLKLAAIKALEVSKRGQRVVLYDEHGQHSIEMVYDRSDALIEQLLTLARGAQIAHNPEALRKLQAQVRAYGQLPTLSSVLRAAAFGSSMMVGLYLLFVQALPHMG